MSFSCALRPKAGKLKLGSPTSFSSSIAKPPKRTKGPPSKFRLAWYLSLVVVFSFLSSGPIFIYALTPIHKSHDKSHKIHKIHKNIKGTSAQTSSRLQFGMSSSDLKNDKNKEKGSPKGNNVVARLARAAKEAVKEQDQIISTRIPSQSTLTSDQEDHIASITDLAQTIDEELLRPRRGGPRDKSSMLNILEHNDRLEQLQLAVVNVNNRKDKNTQAPCHVAVVFSKRLVNDQITAEYASRLQSLALALQDGYQPLLICLCGPNEPVKGDLVSETAAGVVFLRHLCASIDISLDGIPLAIVPHSHEELSLQRVAQEIQRSFLDQWLSKSTVFEGKTDEYGLTRREPRKKIRIHLTLISTDYHLCSLNDIHLRSPRQSPLNTLQVQVSATRKGIVDTTWSFRYSSYPYVYAEDEAVAFLGNCYLLSQDLLPLLVNLRGVVDNAEFFQRDNYRALVATRRSLVTAMEEINDAFNNRNNNNYSKSSAALSASSKLPLKAQLQKIFHWNGYSKDVALERALLSLGRCLDLIRPAGILSAGSIPNEEWKRALSQLETFLQLMQGVCDPDMVFQAKDWGKLSMDSVTISTSSTHTFEEEEEGDQVTADE